MIKEKNTMILGINGDISNVSYMPPAEGYGADIDLHRMAEWAMNYLARSPRPEYGYQPVFQVFPLRFPSVRETYDPITECDTDVRMGWEWFYMRDIAGTDFARDTQEKFLARLRNYINEDGLAIAHGGSYREDLPDAVYDEKDKIIHIWGTVKILRMLCEDYKHSKNRERLEMAGRIVRGLKNLYVWGKDENGLDFCFAPNGVAPVGLDGSKIEGGWKTQLMPTVGPLLDYYKLTGDPDTLAFAKAAAKGYMEGRQPGGVVFAEDGAFYAGHTHTTMLGLWGIAELGIATGEKDYIDFVKRSFDWNMGRGPGTGWVPAATGCDGSETCALSDMISVAVSLGRAGYPEYFDYAERFFRNYIDNLQFILTPEMEAYYRRIHADKPKAEVDHQLELLARIQGAIVGGAGINDYENLLLRLPGFAIYGCCAPEGMRAIHTIWEHTAFKETGSCFLPEGLYINMPFNVDNGFARVLSHMPKNGGVTVWPDAGGKIYIRTPHWADKNSIRSTVNDKQIEVKWSGSYIEVIAESGDKITVEWTLISFTNKARMIPAHVPEFDISFHWLGNMVLASDPPADENAVPIFTGKPRQRKEAPLNDKM